MLLKNILNNKLNKNKELKKEAIKCAQQGILPSETFNKTIDFSMLQMSYIIDAHIRYLRSAEQYKHNISLEDFIVACCTIQVENLEALDKEIADNNILYIESEELKRL